MGGDYSDEMMVDESLPNDEILNLDSSSMIERVVEATPSNQVQENQSLKSTFKDIDETEPPLILNSFASCSTNLQHSASVIMQPVFYRRRIPIELNDKMYRFTVDIDTKKYQLENSIRKKFGNIVMVGYVESLQYTWNEIDDSTLKRLDRVLLVQQK